MSKLDDEMRAEILEIVRKEIDQSERRMAAAICRPEVLEFVQSMFPAGSSKPDEELKK